jgi:hypothetical protein
MERCCSDLAEGSLGHARIGPNVHRLAAWDGRVIGPADALSGAMSREIPKGNLQGKIYKRNPQGRDQRRSKGRGGRPAGIGLVTGQASRLNIVIFLWRFSARYLQYPGLEFAITAFPGVGASVVSIPLGRLDHDAGNRYAVRCSPGTGSGDPQQIDAGGEP